MFLNKKDLKLLYELDSNYRIPYSKVGKKIQMSEQLISHKVKQMMKKRIINRHCPLIDYARFGLLNFIVLFKVHYRSEDSFSQLIEKLERNRIITTILECDGKYDLLVVFSSDNPSSFNKQLTRLVSENTELRDWIILTTVVEHHYMRNYLVGKVADRAEDVVVGGDRDELDIDYINRGVIRGLVHGKKRITDIANTLGITPKTALSRLRWLEKNGIVRDYRLSLNLKNAGIHTDTILIKYRNITKKEEEEFRYFCRSNPNVIELIKSFGEWDVILQVETRSQEEFRRLYLRIKEKFDDVISEVDNFHVFAVHKKQFLPEEILEQQ